MAGTTDKNEPTTNAGSWKVPPLEYTSFHSVSEESLEEIDLLHLEEDYDFGEDEENLKPAQQNSCLHRAMHSFTDIVNTMLHQSFDATKMDLSDSVILDE